VNKILILTGHSEGSEGHKKLKTLLTMLFPECEIQISSMGTERFIKDVPADPEPITDDKGGTKNGKHFNHR
jgi:hypothetical protein